MYQELCTGSFLVGALCMLFPSQNSIHNIVDIIFWWLHHGYQPTLLLGPVWNRGLLTGLQFTSGSNLPELMRKPFLLAECMKQLEASPGKSTAVKELSTETAGWSLSWAEQEPLAYVNPYPHQQWGTSHSVLSTFPRSAAVARPHSTALQGDRWVCPGTAPGSAAAATVLAGWKSTTES